MFYIVLLENSSGGTRRFNGVGEYSIPQIELLAGHADVIAKLSARLVPSEGVSSIYRRPIIDPLTALPATSSSWIIHDTVAGANASANLYSLIETAKANGIEPYAYLRTVFTELPQATSVDEIEALLPVPNDGADSARVS